MLITMSWSAAVITVSDKGYSGLREDTGGPLAAELLSQAGYEVKYTSIVPDEMDMIENELIKTADELDIALTLTTGGTGFSPRDITPEATVAVCQRLAPGIGEAMRYESLKVTNRAMLSRAAAGIRGKTLIVNLPGSPKAIRENLAAVLPALDHGLEMLRKEQKDH
jgi:molybdenum cofactor synthesis domain-containing protein